MPMQSESLDSGYRSPRIECHHLPEPLLVFGDGGMHIDPKTGIAQYGPRSYMPTRRHPASVRVGFIGTAGTIDTARNWLDANAEGVLGDAKHPEFPGFMADRGFFSSLTYDDTWVEPIRQSELAELLGIRASRNRFEQVVSLFDEKLRLLAERDQAPEYVVIALPDNLIAQSGTVDFRDRQQGDVHRDLHRALKAVAMKHRLPTQVVRQATMEGRDDDHPSKIAWNFFTGLYFKAGGIPWSPVGLTPGTCFVGISFFHPLGTSDRRIQTSLVQAFDEHGDGLVLRGHDFEWDAKKEGSRSPHLNEDQASQLIQMVLDRYEAEMHQLPRRVVVHKTSQYWPREREGFGEALRSRVALYDLVALTAQNKVRLITSSKYPPLRGTWFAVGDLDYLYTTGFVPELGEFHGMHVPSPVQLSDHVGQDTSREMLLKEVLLLSKMNWNSAHLGGLLPITIRFSRLVGDTLREVPADRDPRPQFKYYM